LKILVSGASGLVGGTLLPALAADGHTIGRLIRPGSLAGSPDRPEDIPWDPGSGLLEPARAEGTDAVIHLAGEAIAGGPWTAARKRRIRDSRVTGTRRLAESLAALESPPRVFLVASAIGFYGNRGDEPLDETAPAGHGFLPAVCRAWEDAAAPARERGLRVVHLRIGVVLARGGGILAPLLPLFRLGLGAVLGTGREWLSWIDLEDVAAAMRHALACEELSGPVNLVAPNPVTSRAFADELARALGRPRWLAVPAPIVRLFLGDMGRELALASSRVIPARLAATGFAFRHERLPDSLRHQLERR
jgi:uncharacterized protein (TIGR01777 family)